MNYVDVGEGDALVLVHGLAASWQNWLENIPRLARSRRVIAIDLPGFGRSQVAAGETSIDSFVRVVSSLCRELGLSRIDYAGNSMGGQIGIRLAAGNPTLVRRLILVSPAGLSTSRIVEREVARFSGMGVLAGRYATRYRRGLAARPGFRRRIFRGIVYRPELMSPALAFELLDGIGRRGLVPAFRSLAKDNVRELLAGVAAPTVVLWGRHDRMVPLRDADVFAGEIPTAEKVVYPDTAHLSMLEQPERFNELVETFLPPSADGPPHIARATSHAFHAER